MMRVNLWFLLGTLLLGILGGCQASDDVVYCNPNPGSVVKLLADSLPLPTRLMLPSDTSVIIDLNQTQLYFSPSSFERTDGQPIAGLIQLEFRGETGFANLLRYGLSTYTATSQGSPTPLELMGFWFVRFSNNGVPLRMRVNARPLVFVYQLKQVPLSATLGSARQLQVYAGLSVPSTTSPAFQQWSNPSTEAGSFVSSEELRVAETCTFSLYPTLFNQSTTGWYACGQPIKDGALGSTIRISSTDQVLSANNTVAAVRLDDYNSLLPAHLTSNGGFEAVNIPLNARVTAIVLTVPANGYYYFGQQSGVAASRLSFNVPLQRYAPAQVLSLLQAM